MCVCVCVCVHVIANAASHMLYTLSGAGLFLQWENTVSCKLDHIVSVTLLAQCSTLWERKMVGCVCSIDPLPTIRSS